MRKQQSFSENVIETMAPSDIRRLSKIAGEQAEAMKVVLRSELALLKGTGLDASRNLLMGSTVNLAHRLVNEVLAEEE